MLESGQKGHFANTSLEPVRQVQLVGYPNELCVSSIFMMIESCLVWIQDQQATELEIETLLVSAEESRDKLSRYT